VIVKCGSMMKALAAKAALLFIIDLPCGDGFSIPRRIQLSPSNKRVTVAVGARHRQSGPRTSNLVTTGLSHRHVRLSPRRESGPGRSAELMSSASASTEPTETRETLTDTPLPVAMSVGIVCSLIGYLYSKCLKCGFKVLWETIPTALFRESAGAGGGLLSVIAKHPSMYIPLVVTLGGLAVAILNTIYFPSMASAHDFVHVLSDNKDDDKMDRFPKARYHLLPVMCLSVLTSISGFSLGPEAPMVTAGGLVGVSLARKYIERITRDGADVSRPEAASLQESLAYCGAAGTITGFMNVPLVGPVFALEMTSRSSGISQAAAKNWKAAIAASLVGMTFIKALLQPKALLGGHFNYLPRASVGVLSGSEAVLSGLACGLGGAVVGTSFQKTVRLLKSMIWTGEPDKESKQTSIAKKVLVALSIGLLSRAFPQTMFWGEGSLQCVLDGQCTAFAATSHGLPAMLTQAAMVCPNSPYGSALEALQVGLAKFAAITLASAGKFPGGIIFPLMANGAILANSILLGLSPVLSPATSSLLSPATVMAFMAASLTSITRTPLATVLILALTASGLTPLSALLPGVLLASYSSVWISDWLSQNTFYSYSE